MTIFNTSIDVIPSGGSEGIMNFLQVTKGNFNSPCHGWSVNFEMSFWCQRFDQKKNKNIVRISALKFFVASWGLPGSFLWLPGDLVSNIIKRKPT